jgi:BMFP domain-containing protein YqiC
MWCTIDYNLLVIGARQSMQYLSMMIDRKLFDELGSRIDEALRESPAQDIEKNLRALLAAWFDRLDLVLREDFEVQRKLLERAQAKLAELEARIAELEVRKPR